MSHIFSHTEWEAISFGNCLVIIFKINNQSELYAAVILTMIIVLCPMRNVNDEHNVESKCAYHPLYSVWIWLYGCGRCFCFAVLNTARTSKVFLQLLIPSKVMRVNLKVTFGKPSVYEFLRIGGGWIYLTKLCDLS